MLGRRCHGVRGLVSTGLGKRVVDLPLLCLVGRRASVSVGGSVGGWTDIGGMNDGWMLAPWVAKAHHPHALPLPTTRAPRVFLRAIEEQEKRGRGAAQSEEKSDILFSYSRKLSRLELARCFRLLFVGYLMESGSQCKICSPISSARLQRRRSIAAVGLGSRPGSRVTTRVTGHLLPRYGSESCSDVDIIIFTIFGSWADKNMLLGCMSQIGVESPGHKEGVAEMGKERRQKAREGSPEGL